MCGLDRPLCFTGAAKLDKTAFFGAWCGFVLVLVEMKAFNSTGKAIIFCPLVVIREVYELSATHRWRRPRILLNVSA